VNGWREEVNNIWESIRDVINQQESSRADKMERSPVFPSHKKGRNPQDYLRNYLCPYYDQ
jgi:hypothetical protein